MSPRKTILRQLSQARAGSTGGFTRPSSIAGYTAQPERFQKAVNELLQSRLVEGRQDDEGRMTIALNEHRLTDVRRELRPVWAHPALWAALAAVMVAVAFFAI